MIERGEARRTFETLVTVDTDECVVWPHARHRQGYGNLFVGRRFTLVHRLAWERLLGDIPAGMRVLHRCDNPPCFNVRHLFLGTQRDNIQDMIDKGRANRSRGEAHFRTYLTDAQVAEARQRYQDGERPGAIAVAFNTPQSTMSGILHGKVRR